MRAALGTVLAFMMAVIGLSLPEMIILRKVLKIPLIATFAGVVGLGILVVGYLFNICSSGGRSRRPQPRLIVSKYSAWGGRPPAPGPKWSDS